MALAIVEAISRHIDPGGVLKGWCHPLGVTKSRACRERGMFPFDLTRKRRRGSGLNGTESLEGGAGDEHFRGSKFGRLSLKTPEPPSKADWNGREETTWV